MKIRLFLENTRILYDHFSIIPLLYGSLGLEVLTNEFLNSDDIDILIPEIYLKERWDDFKSFLISNGYKLYDVHEHTFVKNDVYISYASLEGLETFVGININEINKYDTNGIQYLLLSLEQYLKVYTKSINDGYRINVRKKKDKEKIDFIKSHI